MAIISYYPMVNIIKNVIVNDVMGESLRSFEEAKTLAATPEFAIHMGKLYGGLGVSILMSRDSDPCSAMICDAFLSGLLSVGSEVWDAGTVATPIAAMAAKDYDRFVAVCSSSTEKGKVVLKLFNNDGSFINISQQRELYERYNNEEYKIQVSKNAGSVHKVSGITDTYSDVVVRGHDGNGSPIILDCGCGCTAYCAPQILARIGSDITCINGQIDPNYRYKIYDVGGDNLSDTNELVAANLGSVGIALNSDGTRMALIDEGGRYVSLEETLALFLMYMRPTSLAIPASMSALITDAFWGNMDVNVITDAKYSNGRKIIRTDGKLESTISALMNSDVDMGVTSDGLFIFKKNSFCADGVYMSVIASEIAGRNSIRSMISSLPTYYTLNDVVHYSDNREVMSKKIAEALADLEDATVLDIRGWRVDMKEGWFMITFSSDAPNYINIRAESRDKIYAVSMMELAKATVFKCI